MKPTMQAIAVLLCATMLFNSCAVSKNAVNITKITVSNSGATANNCFIQLNDGTIKQFTTLKLVTGILTTPHLLGDDQIIINPNEIIAYQNEKLYAVTSKMLTSKRSAAVASETLPGFAVKILSGKLNVYYRKYYNGANIADEYFLQNGNDGFIVSYSKAVLKNMLKEDNKALEYFNSKTKSSPRSKKMLTAVEIYNSGQLMTKN